MSKTVIDGVHRYPTQAIRVTIIGAGVAGLQAALECWRKGCEVVVLERATELSPVGDFFTIIPSALTTLKDYPRMFEDYHSCVYDCSIQMLTPDGRRLISTNPEWKRPGVTTVAPNVNVSFLKRRPTFAKMQLDQVIRLGIPVYWGEKVTLVTEHEKTVTVTTSSGKTFEGDICIGAHGVSGVVPGFDAGPNVEVQESGYAMARVAWERSRIANGSLASSLLKHIDQRPEFRVYVGRDVHLILFLTPDWVAFGLTHRDDSSARESWNNYQGPDRIVQYLQGASEKWDPAVLDFVLTAPNQIVDWKLNWRDGAEQWTSDGGRLVRIGDAAHAFFPTAGNGAVQGLEDAVSLGECIRIAGRASSHLATKIHNKLRFERVSILQQTGIVNREELHNVDAEAMASSEQPPDTGFLRLGQWVWNHDPEIYARENYEACLAHIRNNEPFKNTNIPPGHLYRPWTLQSEMKRQRDGNPSDLKRNGDWSV